MRPGDVRAMLSDPDGVAGAETGRPLDTAWACSPNPDYGRTRRRWTTIARTRWRSVTRCWLNCRSPGCRTMGNNTRPSRSRMWGRRSRHPERASNSGSPSWTRCAISGLRVLTVQPFPAGCPSRIGALEQLIRFALSRVGARERREARDRPVRCHGRLGARKKLSTRGQHRHVVLLAQRAHHRAEHPAGLPEQPGLLDQVLGPRDRRQQRMAKRGSATPVGPTGSPPRCRRHRCTSSMSMRRRPPAGPRIRTADGSRPPMAPSPARCGQACVVRRASSSRLSGSWLSPAQRDGRRDRTVATPDVFRDTVSTVEGGRYRSGVETSDCTGPRSLQNFAIAGRMTSGAMPGNCIRRMGLARGRPVGSIRALLRQVRVQLKKALANPNGLV